MNASESGGSRRLVFIAPEINLGSGCGRLKKVDFGLV